MVADHSSQATDAVSAHPAGRQFYRERQPVKLTTNIDYKVGFLFTYRLPCLPCGRPFHEELDSWKRQRLCCCQRHRTCRVLERPKRVNVLALGPQGLAAS